MSEAQFIELVLRYLDQAASPGEVDRLGAAMLDDAERRTIYRDLVQQAQLAHEWQASDPVPASEPRERRPITTLLYAAAAALVLAALFLLRPDSTSPDSPSAASTQPVWSFPEHAPSWSEIYPSPFDYPEFVWRSELPAENGPGGSIDVFSESGLPPQLAEPTPEFNRLLAPIVLLPSADYSDRWL